MEIPLGAKLNWTECNSFNSYWQSNFILLQVKKQLKGGPIFTPDGFVAAIRAARKQGCSYSVNELTFQDFVDIKDLTQNIGPINTTAVKISDLKILKVEKGKQNTVFCKYSYEETEFCEHVIIKKWKSGKIVKLKPAFIKKPGIAPNKKDDLISLLDKGFIPKFYEHFYRSL